LPAGSWVLDVAAPGFGRQTRDLVLEPGRRGAVSVEVLLGSDLGESSVLVTVTDPEGWPLEAARVVLDGRPFGDTGPGGTLEIADLAAGKHRVEVTAEGFQTLEQPDLLLGEAEEKEVPFVLDRLPGSVRRC
jgi:hypothetical protein